MGSLPPFPPLAVSKLTRSNTFSYVDSDTGFGIPRSPYAFSVERDMSLISQTNVFETNAVLNCLHLHAVLCEHQHETSSQQHNGKVRLPRDKQTPPPRPVPLGL